ncbi:SpoIIE family protein phosphatase [Sorangium cellulosum]|nr:SpoIIE family protein phosphatase [Sorangium cellulosum]
MMSPADDSLGPAPSSSDWKGHLEIRLGDLPATRRPLTESHIVIGRAPGVQLTLDHYTVSRRHAELFCDPFGRWWIRDLGSTNGTLVNDERINEKVLKPGDRIGIGDYLLEFQLTARAPRVPIDPGGLHFEEDKPTAIRKLGELDPPRIAAKHLFTLMDLSRRLLSIEDATDRFDALCQLMVREDFHGSMALALRLRQNGALTILSGPHRPFQSLRREDSVAPPYISRRVLAAVQDTREPVLAGNLVSDSATVELTMSRDVMALWVVACPLRVDEQMMNLLYVTLPPDFGSVEWLGLIALAAEVYQQAESAWEARRHAQAHAAIERELEMAHQIQRALVPKRLDFKSLDVALGFEPCRWVGGDYVDIVPMPDGRILLAVADVCGKGLQAALVGSSVHTMVRATVDAGRGITGMMDRLNAYLCEYLPEHSFVTMVAVALDPVTGRMECVNAGHPPALVATSEGGLRHLQAAVNPALGVGPVPMEAHQSVLAPGEVLTMYTDGLTELRNSSKQMLGLHALGTGFAKLCAACAGRPVAAIADKLTHMLEEFRGDQLPEDDRAFLLARRI